MESKRSLLYFKNVQHVSIFNQMSPVQALLFYFFKVHLILFSHLLLGTPTGLFPSGVPAQTPYEFIFDIHMLRAHPYHHPGLGLQVTLGGEYKSWISPLCISLRLTSFLLWLNISLSSLFSKTCRLRISLKVSSVTLVFFGLPIFFLHTVIKRPSASQYFNIRKTVATGWQMIFLQQRFLNFLWDSRLNERFMLFSLR
jgi:hypothetical protein